MEKVEAFQLLILLVYISIVVLGALFGSDWRDNANNYEKSKQKYYETKYNKK